MEQTLAAWRAACEPPEEAFVDDLWFRVLRRPPEPAERARVLTELRLGVSRSEVLHRLAVSPEFERVRLLDDAISWAEAERRHGARPRSLRAPDRADADAIAVPWCLARVGDERRVLLVAPGRPALEAAVRRLAPEVTTEPAGEIDLVLSLIPLDVAALEDRLSREGRALLAVPSPGPVLADGELVVHEEEQYAPGPDGWGAVADGGALVCLELRRARAASRLLRALRR